MKTRMWIISLFAAVLSSAASFGQPMAPAFAYSPTPDNKDDPGYSLYKEGYNLILDEGWEAARKKLAEVIAKYPKSDYADDAQYWSAYALMHIDTKKAIEAYKKFIEDYPKSSYCDDAVADLGQLKAPLGVSVSGLSSTGVFVKPDISVMRAPVSGRAHGYSFSYGMHRMSRDLRRELRWMGREKNEKLDPETRLKMEALYAIGESKKDEKSFQTLKDVAIDTKQPRTLREAALDALSDFKTFDALPVYLEIARKDTSIDLQARAIDYIGQYGKDKNKRVDALVDLFYSLPKQRTEQSEMIFYSIAEVGNDKAVDFLAKVALAHDNYDLRTNAVYYLGSIGGEKARGALYEILKGK